MAAYIADKEHKLIAEQLYVYKTIISSIEGERDLFFLDAFGGTGKTLVIDFYLNCTK